MTLPRLRLAFRWFHFVTVYGLGSNLVDKLNAGLEGRNRVRFNPNGRILVDVTRYFRGSMFRSKTTKGANIDSLALADGRFYNLKIGFQDQPADLRINTGLLTDLADYILLCHT